MPPSLPALLRFARDCATLHAALTGWSGRDGPDALQALLRRYLSLLVHWGCEPLPGPPRGRGAVQYSVGGQALGPAELFAKAVEAVRRLLGDDLPKALRRATASLLAAQAIALCQSSRGLFTKTIRCVGLFNRCLGVLGCVLPKAQPGLPFSVEYCVRAVASTRAKQQARPVQGEPHDRAALLQRHPSELTVGSIIAEGIEAVLTDTELIMADPYPAALAASCTEGSSPPTPDGSAGATSTSWRLSMPLSTANALTVNVQ
eukprot:EG_transcript_23221